MLRCIHTHFCRQECACAFISVQHMQKHINVYVCIHVYVCCICIHICIYVCNCICNVCIYIYSIHTHDLSCICLSLLAWHVPGLLQTQGRAWVTDVRALHALEPAVGNLRVVEPAALCRSQGSSIGSINMVGRRLASAPEIANPTLMAFLVPPWHFLPRLVIGKMLQNGTRRGTADPLQTLARTLTLRAPAASPGLGAACLGDGSSSAVKGL